MSTIRIVWGTGTGPTELASYDAALADANVHEYNLVTVSSVIPAAATLEVAGTAPDLGPIGNRLTAVQSRATTSEPGSVSAALGWARSESGEGIVYEAAGETDPDAVRERVSVGLDAGCELRSWSPSLRDVRVVQIDAEPGTYATAVVLAVYGESVPIW